MTSTRCKQIFLVKLCTEIVLIWQCNTQIWCKYLCCSIKKILITKRIKHQTLILICKLSHLSEFFKLLSVSSCIDKIAIPRITAVFIFLYKAFLIISANLLTLSKASLMHTLHLCTSTLWHSLNRRVQIKALLDYAFHLLWICCLLHL